MQVDYQRNQDLRSDIRSDIRSDLLFHSTMRGLCDYLQQRVKSQHARTSRQGQLASAIIFSDRRLYRQLLADINFVYREIEQLWEKYRQKEPILQAVEQIIVHS